MTARERTENSSGGGLAFDLMAQRFAFPNLKGKRVLIVGLGGGCDIISAYALAQRLRRSKATAPAEIVYANTKRHADESLEPLAPHVYRVPANVRKPVAGDFVHGTTQIDQGVKRGDRGCPWIFCLSRETGGQRQLMSSLQQLAEWNLIIAVDTGADSVVATAVSGAEGRDKTMLRILLNLSTPLLHVVVAPGCDGETSAEDLRAAFRRLKKSGQYLGCFGLDTMLSSYREFALSLDPDRTPNILLAAYDGTLPPGPNGGLIVPRGMEPEISRSWLTRAFVFRPGGHSRSDLGGNDDRPT